MRNSFGLLIPACLMVMLSGFAPSPVPCTMNNGKPRPFPCEFRINAIWLMGKNNEVVGKLTPGATTVKLPKSKAVSTSKVSGGESFVYNASVDFTRINIPSFLPKPVPKGLPDLGFYQVSTSTVSSPISPGELALIRRLNVAPALPQPGQRPNRVAFKLQLNYTTGIGATIVAPVQYLQLANPITFTKLPSAVNLYRDRAEAFMAFMVSVDMAK